MKMSRTTLSPSRSTVPLGAWWGSAPLKRRPAALAGAAGAVLPAEASRPAHSRPRGGDAASTTRSLIWEARGAWRSRRRPVLAGRRPPGRSQHPSSVGGRAARRVMRNLLGQAFGPAPSVPGRRAGCRRGLSLSTPVWLTSPASSWGSRAKRALANRRRVPSARDVKRQHPLHRLHPVPRQVVHRGGGGDYNLGQSVHSMLRSTRASLA